MKKKPQRVASCQTHVDHKKARLPSIWPSISQTYAKCSLHVRYLYVQVQVMFLKPGS